MKDQKTYCSCGKEIFASRADAHRALAHMQRKHKACGSVYQCEICQGYHITHFSFTHGKRIRTGRQRAENMDKMKGRKRAKKSAEQTDDNSLDR